MRTKYEIRCPDCNGMLLVLMKYIKVLHFKQISFPSPHNDTNSTVFFEVVTDYLSIGFHIFHVSRVIGQS